MSTVESVAKIESGTAAAKAVAPKSGIDWRKYRSMVALLVIMVVLEFLTQGIFLSPRNLSNLTRQVAINGILSVGMTYVILIAGIDLSVGSIVAFAGVIAAILQVNYGMAQWLGGAAWTGALISILAAVLVGTACGAFNGFLITRYRIAPFIITLGMMVIARGLALIFANGAAIAPLGDAFNSIGQGYIPTHISMVLAVGVGAAIVFTQLRKKEKTPADYLFALITVLFTVGAIWSFEGYRGLPTPVLIFAALAIAGIVILQRTRLGRFVLAIGGNPEAAWLAGVPIRKITFGIYVVIGALAGLCGAILSARLNGAMPTMGDLFELDAIAAVVIGGTSLMGGVGSVRGSVLGAFLIGALNNGMSLMDVTEFYQKVIKGLIIILAVWFDTRESSAGSSKKV